VIRAIDFHPEALQEAEAARDWYAERSPVAARAFVIELTHAIEQVGESPEMWPQYDLTTHRYVFPRFPFSLIYRIGEEVVEIVAVAHAKKKPGYWKDR